MTDRARVPVGRATSEHLVQLFDTPESRASGVSAFLHDGLAHAAPVLAVVKLANWSGIASDLDIRGVDVRQVVATSALTVVDAGTALSTFMRDDAPVRELFRMHMGALVGHLAKTSDQPIRVYGEIVEILAERGEFHAASELEGFWAELACEYPMILLCGYSSAHFGPERSAPALEAICRAHSKVQALATDPLGTWLTESVLRSRSISAV